MQKDFRKEKSNIVVVAEGDSWFEHPFLQDIVDHINRNEDIAVYSLASAADWLDNMLFQGEYIDMLSVIKPDVFLVSAGGNDLLGDKKIGIMCRGIVQGITETNVQNCPNYIYTQTIPERFKQGLIDLEKEGRQAEADAIRAGVKHLTKEFFGFLNIMQWQYDYLFACLRAKYEIMPIFTQSYDYAIPQILIKRPFELAYWYQRPLNEILQSGKWIETAMRNAEFYEPEKMHSSIKAMLYLFKHMVIETAASYKYVYHIDSQGLTKPNEWFDEIHIKSHKFLQVGQAYANAMRKAVALRNELKKGSTITEEIPRVYRSMDTTEQPSFEQAYRAFRSEKSPSNWRFIGLKLLAFGLVFGILYWFSQPVACKLATLVIGLWILIKLYGFLRAVVLSYVFSKKRE
ncbi:hypothetical protein GCM10027275_23330 [Rhabdobacter roseus]